MENPIQMDDLGVPAIDLKPPYTIWSFNKAMEITMFDRYQICIHMSIYTHMILSIHTLPILNSYSM